MVNITKNSEGTALSCLRKNSFHNLLCILLFAISAPTLSYADCTLADMAVCDGVACPGKAFKAGQIIYNSDHNVLQTCLIDNTWKALHRMGLPPDCTTSDTIGTACIDGQTVYAGTWNGSRYYTTKSDQASPAYWGTRGMLLGANAQSATNGFLNTNTALTALEANPQTGSCDTNPYNPPACLPNAHMLCKDLRTTLGGDWYLPARDELINVLYAHKSAIGGFLNTYYWSSTEYSNIYAYYILFSDGSSYNNSKIHGSRVRCVRK